MNSSPWLSWIPRLFRLFADFSRSFWRLKRLPEKFHIFDQGGRGITGKWFKQIISVSGSLNKDQSAGDQILNYYLFKLFKFCESIGIDSSKLRFREQLTDELAHYATVCYDLECRTNIGWVECAGLANRNGSITCVRRLTTLNRRLSLEKNRLRFEKTFWSVWPNVIMSTIVGSSNQNWANHCRSKKWFFEENFKKEKTAI